LDSPAEFFEGTQFKTVDWTRIAAVEQFWFRNAEDAARFFSNEDRKRAMLKLPSSFDIGRTLEMSGEESIVVQKDIDY
jgi:hypothetical protein